MRSLEQLLSDLEAALAARKLLRGIPDATSSALLTLWPQHDPSAQHALEVFAIRHDLKVKTETAYYGADRAPCGGDRGRAVDQIRTLEVLLDDRRVAAVQFPLEPVPRDHDAGSAWSPAHADKQLLEAR